MSDKSNALSSGYFSNRSGQVITASSTSALTFVVAFLSMSLGFLVGTIITSNFKDREAVRAGHAAWVSTPDGYAQFQWKEASK